jgi:ferrochelatase
MADKRKIAVVLFNLGGPDREESVPKFLYNFFMDPNIIRLPKPLRWCLARLIARRRSKREANDSYKELGYTSPLLENTNAQAEALQNWLNENAEGSSEYRTFVAMRYWHPMTPEVVEQVKSYTPDHVVLLPLYPQFSTTTSWSSLGQWRKYAAEKKLDVSHSLVCCYPDETNFITASARNIREKYDAALAYAKEYNTNPPRVLFSAHGLPESIIRDGDPYQYQCTLTADRIAEAMAVDGLDYHYCYQSRVGPQKWLGPSTEEALRKAAEDNVPVIVYPHAFVSEHLETLVELDIEYKQLADSIGIPYYDRAPTVGDDATFIQGLGQLVQKSEAAPGMYSNHDGRICPADYRRCCMGAGITLPGNREAVRVSEPDRESVLTQGDAA